MIPAITRVMTLVVFLAYPLFASGEISSFMDTIVVKNDKGPVPYKTFRVSSSIGVFIAKETADRFGGLTILNTGDVIGANNEMRLAHGEYIVEVFNEDTDKYEQKTFMIWDGKTVDVKPYEQTEAYADELLKEFRENKKKNPKWDPFIETKNKLLWEYYFVEDNEGSTHGKRSKRGIRNGCKDSKLESMKMEINKNAIRLNQAINEYEQGLLAGASTDSLERAKTSVDHYVKYLSAGVRNYNEEVDKTCRDIKPEYLSITDFTEKMADADVSKYFGNKADSYTYSQYGNTVVIKVNGKKPEHPIVVELHSRLHFDTENDKKMTTNTFGEFEVDELEPGSYQMIINDDYKNSRNLKWDGTILSISSVDNRPSSGGSVTGPAVENQDEEAPVIVDEGTKKPLSADDNGWVWEVAAGVGILGYDGTKTGVDNAASDVGGTVNSVDDSSTGYNIEFGASINRLVLNAFYRDGAEFKGSFSPNASTTIEGTESIKSYGATIGYRQNFSNTKWYGTIKGGYMWIKDDFSSTLRNQSGSVSQFSTSDDDESFIAGADIGFKLNRRNAVELSIDSTLDGVFEENKRVYTLGLNIRHYF